MITIHSRRELQIRPGHPETLHGGAIPAAASSGQPGNPVHFEIRSSRLGPGEGESARWDDNVEILTCVWNGTLSHCDSMGNEVRVGAGELQLLSAGTGVTHSEYNRESGTLECLQLRLHPDTPHTEPGYQCHRFPDRSGVTLVGSPDGTSGSLRIRQAVRLWWGRLDDGASFTTALHGAWAWLQLMHGTLAINHRRLQAGEGAEILRESALSLTASGTTGFLLMEPV